MAIGQKETRESLLSYSTCSGADLGTYGSNTCVVSARHSCPLEQRSADPCRLPACGHDTGAALSGGWGGQSGGGSGMIAGGWCRRAGRLTKGIFEKGSQHRRGEIEQVGNQRWL